MAEVSDDLLIRRARYGGRNLVGLAILATLFAAMSLAFVLASPDRQTASVAGGIAAGIMAMATAYWVLAVAARRGNASALSVVIGFIVVQFVLGLTLQVYAYVRTDGRVPLNVVWIILPLVIVFLLARNRSQLIALRRRGLWEGVFGDRPPTGRLCAVGGVLLLIGLLMTYGGIVVSALQDSNDTKIQHDFLVLVNNDEKEFLDALKSWAESSSLEGVEDLLNKATSLHAKTNAILEKTPPSSAMRFVVTKYAEATERWRQAVAAIRDSGEITKQAQEWMDEGDRLRQEAATALAKKAASPKHNP
jgi:hypothetical protein